MISYEDYTRYRDAAKMRDGDVAKAAKIPPSTFTDWKKGKSTPKSDKMNKIANVLGISPSVLMGFDVPMDEDIAKDALIQAYVQNAENKEFIELFQSADPEIRQAVLLFLKSAKHGS